MQGRVDLTLAGLSKHMRPAADSWDEQTIARGLMQIKKTGKSWRPSIQLFRVFRRDGRHTFAELTLLTNTKTLGFDTHNQWQSFQTDRLPVLESVVVEEVKILLQI